MPADAKQRLAYIDWMRGFACLTMFQTHCYDAWLSPAARQTTFFKWSQIVGTLPAPLFLFLAGVSFAMMTDGLRKRGASPGGIARKTIRRGAEIFALGLGFRVFEFTIAQPWAPWTDLLRVDILNVIGLSMMAMGATCWVAARLWNVDPVANLRLKNLAFAAAIGLIIALVTPPLWTTWRPRWLPWYLESYINGVHVFDKPQAWLFPFFPWAAFAFAGLAAGLFLMTDWARARQAKAVALLAGIGAAVGGLAWCLDAQPHQLYAEYDFWHSSPNFLLIRVGVVLTILLLSYVWCRWGPGQLGFSPFIQLGKTSLLVYWVHINFVYTGLSILGRRSQSVLSASFGLLIIFISMVLLSLLRTNLKWRKSAKPV